MIAALTFVYVFTDRSVSINVVVTNMACACITTVAVFTICIFGAIVGLSATFVNIETMESVAIKTVFTSTGKTTIMSVNVGTNRIGEAMVGWYLHCAFNITSTTTFRLNMG